MIEIDNEKLTLLVKKKIVGNHFVESVVYDSDIGLIINGDLNLGKVASAYIGLDNIDKFSNLVVRLLVTYNYI